MRRNCPSHFKFVFQITVVVSGTWYVQGDTNFSVILRCIDNFSELIEIERMMTTFLITIKLNYDIVRIFYCGYYYNYYCETLYKGKWKHLQDIFPTNLNKLHLVNRHFAFHEFFKIQNSNDIDCYHLMRMI